MKLILGRECNSKKIQEWRQLYYIGTIVLKGHIIFLEGEPYNIPGVRSLLKTDYLIFQQFVRNKQFYPETLLSFRASLLVYCCFA